MSETSVRGMAGFRLRQGGQKVGALNVFSDTPGALTEHSLEQAIMLTAFASVTLAALERGEEATTLRRGLESNREIGKAVGLLMAMHNIDDDRAFEMLAKVSQEMNVKVAEVAAQVVAHHKTGKLTLARGTRSSGPCPGLRGWSHVLNPCVPRCDPGTARVGGRDNGHPRQCGVRPCGFSDTLRVCHVCAPHDRDQATPDQRSAAMGTEQKASNKAEELKGKAKETTGKATDDESLENEGKADQSKSSLKQAAENVKDAFKG